MVNLELSRYYDTSKLEAGEYAVKIDGIGFAEFTLTDKPAERNFPFKDLKAEDIEEIQIEDSSCELIDTAILKQGNSEVNVTDETDEYGMRRITADVRDSSYFYSAVVYLRQLELTGVCKNYDPVMGGDDRTKIIFKDGTEVLLDFNGSGEVVYNGKIYYCSAYTCTALENIAEKFTQRNLPFDDIYENKPVRIQFKKIDGETITAAELNGNNADLHNQVVSTYYFELKDVCENYEIPTDGAFQVILIYKDGSKKTLTFYEPDIVMMPDGKIYRCYDSRYYYQSAEMFGKLEHSAGSV